MLCTRTSGQQDKEILRARFQILRRRGLDIQQVGSRILQSVHESAFRYGTAY